MSSLIASSHPKPHFSTDAHLSHIETSSMRCVTLLLVSVSMLPAALHAQDDLSYDRSAWQWNTSIGGTISNVSYSHWASGGEYSYALGLDLNSNPQWSDSIWSFIGSVDGQFSTFRSKSHPPNKIEDRLEINLKWGKRLIGDFHAVLFGDLQTQFWPGYDFIFDGSGNDYISNFLAPGYLTSGLGIDYRNDSLGLSVVATPIAAKTAIVLDHGVDPTQFGVPTGHHFSTESGMYSRITFNHPLFDRTTFSLKTILFFDYNQSSALDVSSLAEIDVNATSFLVLFVQAHVLSDDDMKVNLYEDLDGDGSPDDFAGVGARTQVFAQIGVKIQARF